MVSRLFFSRSDSEVDENIKNVRNGILRMGGEGAGFDRMELLTRYRQVVSGKRVADDDTDGVCAALRLSGLVTSEKGWLRSRNRVYAKLFDAAWVRENLPDAEQRRQRAAVAKARWQVGLIAAAVFIAMGTLTAFAVTSRNAALLAKTEADTERTKALASAQAETRAKTEADTERTKAQDQAQAALDAKNQAQTALEGESAAKRTAQQNALLAQQSAAQAHRNAMIAEGEKGRAQAQTRLAEAYSDKAQRLIYTSDSNLAQRAMEDSRYALAQTYLNDMGHLLKRNPHLEAGYEWLYLNEQMHRERREIKVGTGGISSVAISPDGKTLATGRQDGVARLWELATGKEIRRLQGTKDSLYQIAFSPDGTKIAAGGKGKVLYFWDANTGHKILQIDSVGFVKSISAIAFSPDGKRIVTSSNEEFVSIWDTVTGKKVARIEQKKLQIVAASFSPDGSKIATGGSVLQLWDAATGKPAEFFQENKFYTESLAFSPDGKRIATVGALGDGTPRIWDAKTGANLLQLKKQGGQSVAFSQDGNQLLMGCEDGSARVWDATTGQELVQFGGHTSVIGSALFSPDGQTIVTLSFDGDVRLWNVAEMRNEGFGQGLGTRVTSLALSPDGKQYATGNGDHTVHLRDVATGKELWFLKGLNSSITVKYTDNVSTGTSTFRSDSCCVAFSPNGKQILVGNGSDSVARIYDVAMHKEIRQLRGHKSYVAEVAFSPDGKRIATGGGFYDGTIRIWDATTGRQLWKLKRHDGQAENAFSPEVTVLAFSPDSKRLLTVIEQDKSGVGHLWDVATGRELLILKDSENDVDFVYSAAFSPDGKRIVAGKGRGGNALVWDAATGKILLQLQGHKDRLYAVTFSPDGKRIATASMDGTARLWDAATGNELLRLTAPPSPTGTSNAVHAIAFAPDGKQLFTGREDGVRIWRKMTDLQIATKEKEQKEIAEQKERTTRENATLARLKTVPLESLLQEAQLSLLKMPTHQADVALILNTAAWLIVDPAKTSPTPERAKTALHIAEKAVALTGGKDGAITDTLAAARFACGDLDGALEAERDAVKHLPADKKTAALLTAQLAQYEKLKAEKTRAQK